MSQRRIILQQKLLLQHQHLPSLQSELKMDGHTYELLVEQRAVKLYNPKT